MFNGAVLEKAVEAWAMSNELLFVQPMKTTRPYLDALAHATTGEKDKDDEVTRFQTVLNIVIEAQRHAHFGKPIKPSDIVNAAVKRPFAERLSSMIGLVPSPLPLPPCARVAGLPGGGTGECVKASPKEHQIDMARFVRDRDGLIVVHEPGTGKTLLATMGIKCWLDQDVDNRAIVVTPSTNVDAFIEHLLCAFPKENSMQRAYRQHLARPVLFPTSRMKQGRVDIITSRTFQLGVDSGKIQCDKHLMLIVDEAHLGFTHDITVRQQEERPVEEGDDGKKKKEEAKTAAAALKCTRRAGKRILMTATPVTNEPYKFANLVAMARGDDRVLPRPEFEKMLRNHWNGDSLDALIDGYRKGELQQAAFKQNAAELRSNRKYRDFVRQTEMPTLLPALEAFVEKWRAPFSNYLACLVTFKRRDPPGPNFPTVAHVRDIPELEVPMTPAFYDAYMEREKTRQPNENAFLNAVRIASYKMAGESPKLDWIVQKMKENTQSMIADDNAWRSRRTFIFSSYKDASTIPMYEALIASGMDPSRIARIDGKVPKKRRKQIIDDFNQGKQDVMIGTVVMNVGVSLKGVRDVFLLEPQWSEADEEQAWSRAVRANSHAHLPLEQRAVNVYQPVLVKPKDKASLPGEKISADQRVIDLKRAKQPEIDEFLRILQDVSIERNPEMCLPPGVLVQ